MASFRMRAFGPWRQVKTLADVEDNPEFEGFGGLEVLESYEIVKVSFSKEFFCFLLSFYLFFFFCESECVLTWASEYLPITIFIMFVW